MHALKLAPDKSSINTSSCSEDITAKEQEAAEPEESKEEEEAVKGPETGDKETESESKKEEAVNNCDEKDEEENVTAEVEKIPSAGIFKFCVGDTWMNEKLAVKFFNKDIWFLESSESSENKSASEEKESKT